MFWKHNFWVVWNRDDEIAQKKITFETTTFTETSHDLSSQFYVFLNDKFVGDMGHAAALCRADKSSI
jgi:hypothetical protein